MSSPCPGTDFIEEVNRTPIDEPYPGYRDVPPTPTSQPDGYASDPGDEKEYNPGLGAQGRYDSIPSIRRVDPRTVPPKPIEDMTVREFLHWDSRNPNNPSSKRKVFASLITQSDANYQAFIDIVAIHMLDNKSDFMMRVLQSGHGQIVQAEQHTLLDLLRKVGK